MVKIFICLFVYTLVNLNNAQNPLGLAPPPFVPIGTGPSGFELSGFGPGIGAIYGLSQAQYYKNWALLFAIDRLATADLPQDLKDAADKVITDADVRLGACSLFTQTAPWQYLRCSLLQLTSSLEQIKAIEKEAEARKLSAVVVSGV